jgi:biotin transport system substrate-specific component
MSKSATQTRPQFGIPQSGVRVSPVVWNLAVVVSASLFVAVCARVTVPLPFTPVPLTLQNFGVLLVGLALGPRRAFAAMVLYLAEGAMGMPVFNPAGLGGIAQLLGPTGGYLMAYPLVAAVAGWIFNRYRGLAVGSRFATALIGATIAETLLFVCGVAWFMQVTHLDAGRAVQFALYPFVFAEVIKIMSAAALAQKFTRFNSPHSS